jgi:hypothetical protein
MAFTDRPGECPMKIALTSFTLLVWASACFAQETVPAWLQTRIATYQAMPPANPPRAVFRAAYQGKIVYYVSPACCDIPSELYDENGALICYPDGGFAGGDGRCSTFRLGAGVPAIVWRDSRSAHR